MQPLADILSYTVLDEALMPAHLPGDAGENPELQYDDQCRCEAEKRREDAARTQDPRVELIETECDGERRQHGPWWNVPGKQDDRAEIEHPQKNREREPAPHRGPARDRPGECRDQRENVADHV